MTNAESFEDLLLEAYPNPNRMGCLSSTRLREMAENPPALDDPAAVHVRQCSPCFAEFAGYRDSRRARERRTTTLRVATAACLVGVAVLGVAGLRRPHTAEHAPTPVAVEMARLDFSSDSASRGVDDTAPAELKVKSTVNIFEIVLPVGSAAGSYDIEIRSAANIDAPLGVTQTVPLVERDQHSLLTYRLTSPLAKGSYVAAWRLHGTELWHYGYFVTSP